MSSENLERLWNTEEVAEHIGVAPATIRKWKAEYRIPFVKLHGTVRFVPSDIRAWVEANMHPAIGS